MLYEDLSQEAFDEHLNLIERNLYGIGGIIIGKEICIENDISTFRKNEVLRHELEHYYTNTDNLTVAPKALRYKAERIADRRTILKLVPLDKLINSYLNGINDENELSFLFEVEVDFLFKALEFYQGIFGDGFKYKGMIINFLPFNIIKEK